MTQAFRNLGFVYDPTVSPDGKSVYVGDEFSDRLLIFDRDVSTGGLSSRGYIENLSGGVNNMSAPTGIAVSL